MYSEKLDLLEKNCEHGVLDTCFKYHEGKVISRQIEFVVLSSLVDKNCLSLNFVCLCLSSDVSLKGRRPGKYVRLVENNFAKVEKYAR